MIKPMAYNVLQYGARDRNRTGTLFTARDFKSLVSTYFTTRAKTYLTVLKIVADFSAYARSI